MSGRPPWSGDSHLYDPYLWPAATGEDIEVERIWTEEAKRRREDLRRNPAAGIPAEEVFARLRSGPR